MIGKGSRRQTKFEIHKKASDPKLSESEFTDWYWGAWYNFDKPEWCSSEDCTDAELETFKSDLGLAEAAISAAGEDTNLSARMAAASSGQKDGYDNVFVDLNRNFWAKLKEVRQANREAAAAKRAEIAAGKVAGGLEINAKELRGRPLHEAHVIYCIWLEMGKPTINSDFLQAVRDRLLNRPKAKWLPSFLLREAEADRKGNLRFTEEQIRQMRRSIKKAQDVCIAVSKGRFPG